MKKYEIVYEKIKSDIVDGSIGYGKKIPPKRVAAEHFGVSVITIETAYGILESEGYIESRARSGFYSIYTADGVIAEERFSAATVVPTAAAGSEHKFPFSVYSAAVRSVLNDYGEEVLQKSDGSGSPVLKKAIKNYLKTSRDIVVDEDRIIIGSGAENLYGMIVKLLGNKRKFALEYPCYGQIEKVYAANGVEIERLTLGADGIPAETLKNAESEILHVTPYRSFPTGVSATASKKAEYLRFASVRGGYVIEDDYESEFSLNARLTETLFGSCKDDRVIYINTFSKTISPAIRVGYMILPSALAKEYNEKLGFYSCSVPVLEQLVIAKIINDGSFVRHLNRVRRQRDGSLRAT